MSWRWVPIVINELLDECLRQFGGPWPGRIGEIDEVNSEPFIVRAPLKMRLIFRIKKL